VIAECGAINVAQYEKHMSHSHLPNQGHLHGVTKVDKLHQSSYAVMTSFLLSIYNSDTSRLLLCILPLHAKHARSSSLQEYHRAIGHHPTIFFYTYSTPPIYINQDNHKTNRAQTFLQQFRMQEGPQTST
jgi:hypothetical protein